MLGSYTAAVWSLQAEEAPWSSPRGNPGENPSRSVGSSDGAAGRREGPRGCRGGHASSYAMSKLRGVAAVARQITVGSGDAAGIAGEEASDVTACGVNESFPLLRKRVCGLLCGEPSVEFYCDAVLLRFSS